MENKTEYEREAYFSGYDDGYISGVDNTLDEVIVIIDHYLEEIHPPHDRLAPCIRCDYVAVIGVLRNRIINKWD